jgi:hypothetical protein
MDIQAALEKLLNGGGGGGNEEKERKESLNQHHHNDAYFHLHAINYLSQAPQRSAPKGYRGR